MLMPRKVRHRKQQRGRMRGQATGGTRLAFGEYGIQAIEPKVETIPAPVAEAPDTTPQQDAPSSDADQDKKPRGGRQTKTGDTE